MPANVTIVPLKRIEPHREIGFHTLRETDAPADSPRRRRPRGAIRHESIFHTP